jgi:hypothetical protein
MTDNTPMRDVADAAVALVEEVTSVPDSPRQRFIGCAAEAARLAIQLDAPAYEIEERLWALMSMMSVNLKEWRRGPS